MKIYVAPDRTTRMMLSGSSLNYTPPSAHLPRRYPFSVGFFDDFTGIRPCGGVR
jgi:hypothetical protein